MSTEEITPSCSKVEESVKCEPKKKGVLKLSQSDSTNAVSQTAQTTKKSVSFVGVKPLCDSDPEIAGCSSGGSGRDTVKADSRFNCIGSLRSSFRCVRNNSSRLMTMHLIRSKLRKREEHREVGESSRASAAYHNGAAVTLADETIEMSVVCTGAVADENKTLEAAGAAELDGATKSVPKSAEEIIKSEIVTASKSNGVAGTSASSPSKAKLAIDIRFADHETLAKTFGMTEPLERGKGGRGSFRCKIRQLMGKKHNPEDFKIPDELRPQLRQIYVY